MKLRNGAAITLLGLGVVAMLFLGQIMIWLASKVGGLATIAIIACSASLLCTLVALLIIPEDA